MTLDGIIHSKSKTFLVFCFSILFGVSVMSVTDWRIDFVYFYLSLFSVISGLIIFWQKFKIRFFVILLLGLLIGVARYTLGWPGYHDISHLNGGAVTLTGRVAADPDIRTDGVRYIVEVKNVNGQSKKYNGQVYVKTNLYPRYRYGDALELRCSLEEPRPIENKTNPRVHAFRYDMYLARYGIFSICMQPKVSFVSSGGPSLMAALLVVKDNIDEHGQKLWHEPYASFMAGLLYGYRGGLGELNNDFVRGGISHIVAISGFNISIIAAALLAFLTRLSIRRQKAFYIIVIGIAAFTIATGASGSAVRAAIMGFLVLLAKQWGRLSRIGPVMATTATIMVLLNPFMLFWDVGFQLSFLSTIGIVYLTPLFLAWTKKWPALFTLKELFLTTMAAIAATLPLSLYQFGQLSIVAPLVNVLILWLVPWLTLAGFVAVMTSFLSYLAGSWFAAVAWLGMKYIVMVVTYFSRISFASLPLIMPWWGMVGIYALGTRFFYRALSRSPNT